MSGQTQRESRFREFSRREFDAECVFAGTKRVRLGAEENLFVGGFRIELLAGERVDCQRHREFTVLYDGERHRRGTIVLFSVLFPPIGQRHLVLLRRWH